MRDDYPRCLYGPAISVLVETRTDSTLDDETYAAMLEALTVGAYETLITLFDEGELETADIAHDLREIIIRFRNSLPNQDRAKIAP